MNVVVTCAGEGSRFRNKGYAVPKPFIRAKGKTILEWTTRSCDFISPFNELVLAIRSEHDSYIPLLNELYPDSIILSFDRTTRGNLETAYVCAKSLRLEEPLIVLDCDNAYVGGLTQEVLDGFKRVANGQEHMAVVYFDPLDDSSKWAFAFMDGDRVTSIEEKSPTALERGGKPMVGVFYFSSTELFLAEAEARLKEPANASEYYMSMLPASGVCDVFAHRVSKMIPLGTPEDVEAFCES